MSSKTRRYLILGIRLLLGAVFLLSGIGKLIDASEARYLVELAATHFYWLIEYTQPIILSTSIVELLLGGLLLSGYKPRWSLGGAFLMLAFFSGVLAFFYLQGYTVENCGCFGALGGGGGLEFTLLRNLVLIGFVVGGVMLSFRDRGE
ncbi:MAG: MauE/DoxX family redox-associated membrane protein [Balneolaceae bacterium]